MCHPSTLGQDQRFKYTPPVDITLEHVSPDEVEVDLGWFWSTDALVTYHFYLRVTDLVGPGAGTMDLYDATNDFSEVVDLFEVTCGDYTTYPGYDAFDVNTAAIDFGLGNSKADGICDGMAPGQRLFAGTSTFWTGTEDFVYTFHLNGVESGPHTFTMPADAFGGGGGDGPGVPSWWL